MLNGRAFPFPPSLLLAVIAFPLGAQSVISTHAGLVHFFEGTVYLEDQQLQPHLGVFPTVPQGGELRTADGRVELLLTPDVFLRLGEKSAIRMIANTLADTQIELRAGSAVVDSGKPNPDTSVTLIVQDWRVHILQKGIYRIDSDPPRLSVQQGKADVFAGANGQPISVGAGMSLPLAQVLVPERSIEQTTELTPDPLSDWETGRSESIAADNAITAQIDEDPSSRQSGLDTFSYFPFLGGSAAGLGLSSLYGSSYIAPQPGFSSIYLPGYSYQPMFLGLIGRGAGIYYPLPSQRLVIVGRPIGMTPIPRGPASRVFVPAAPVHGANIGSHVGHR